MPAIDAHQHLWPEPVLRLLEQRSEAPSACYDGDGAWTLTLANEPAFGVSEAVHGVAARAAAVTRAGLDRAIVALSSPVGIDALAGDAAAPLLDAWHAAVAELPPALEGWAAVAVARPDVDALAAALDAGAAGACIPAFAFTTPQSIERLGPVLELLEQHMAPAFIHPGPAGGPSPTAWWAPCTDYVAELHAAWHGFASWARPAHPRLRVLFAALAGLAPLHAERTGLRGGPVVVPPDPAVYYDVSSYGARALRAMAGAVGVGQLVHGTDEPVAHAPIFRPLGHDAHDAMRTTNVAHLLGREWSPL